MEEQIAERVCPTEVLDSDEPPPTLKTVHFGSYELRLPKNFLQIDATGFHRKGDPMYVNGELTTNPVDKAWVEIHALAPDMVPHFLMSPKQERRRNRGTMYHVGIALFWSEDGTWVPDDGEKSIHSTKTGAVEGSYIAVGAGLVQDATQERFGTRKFIPADAVAGKPFLVPKIICSEVCFVVRRLGPDLWMRYNYNRENLGCWADIDTRVTALLTKYLKHKNRP